jgi:predicted nucleic acid-binding protein
MIVLDTNVVSEAMRPVPSPLVLDWLNEQPIEALYTTAVTLAEIHFGLARLPSGRRKDLLAEQFELISRIWRGRVLPFDGDAARQYATLAVAAHQAGRGFPTPDGYIAAIAASRGFVVATRDVAPFQAAGLQVINPWEIREE